MPKENTPKVEKSDLDFIKECKEYYQDFITKAKKAGNGYAQHQIQWVNENYPNAFKDVDLNFVNYILTQYVFFSNEKKAAEFALYEKPPFYAAVNSELYRRLLNLWSKNDEEARLRAIALCLILQDDAESEREMNYAMVRGPM